MAEHSPEVIAEVLKIYRTTRGSPFKTARLSGIDVAEVFKIIEQNQENVAAATERFGGFGRPEMQSFIVARRRANDREWDNTLPEIVAARAKFCAGTHTMTTGRDGAWLNLYLIPLRWPSTPRPDYFIPEHSA